MIIGLNGPIGSGKNTVAEILERNWGFKAIGFADKLKESAAALFNIDPELWNTIKNDPGARVFLRWTNKDAKAEWYNEESVSAREFLKRYGTEAHRDVFWNDFWVDMLINRDNSYLFGGSGIVIYDARFDNELSRIRKEGGVNIQVRRRGHEFDPTHPSETAPNPDLIDWYIQNDGTLEDLENGVNELVRSERLVNPALLEKKDNLGQSPSPQPALSS